MLSPVAVRAGELLAAALLAGVVFVAVMAAGLASAAGTEGPPRSAETR